MKPVKRHKTSNNKTQGLLFKRNIKEQEMPEQYTPKQQKLIRIVKSLENGDIDLEFLEGFVDGIEKLLDKLEEENILHIIDPFDSTWEDIQNYLFYAFYQKDPSFIWKIVDKYLSDVVQKNGKYYYITDADELASYFEEGWRSEISRETIASILEGEYEYLYYYTVTDDVYRDVYDELTPENKNKVNNRIKSELMKIEKMEVTSRTPDLFDTISNEQNKEGEFDVTEEVIQQILSDDESIEYLVNIELNDTIGSDLYVLYEGCYNGVLSNSYYKSIISELEGYVIDNGNIESYSYEKTVFDKEGNPQRKTLQKPMYEATNCIYEIVSEWISNNKTGTETVDYYGSLNGLLDNLIYHGERDKISQPRLDDYPDSREVRTCVNENIGDYF